MYLGISQLSTVTRRSHRMRYIIQYYILLYKKSASVDKIDFPKVLVVVSSEYNVVHL